jgi:hypothetical protein
MCDKFRVRRAFFSLLYFSGCFCYVGFMVASMKMAVFVIFVDHNVRSLLDSK